MRGMLSHRGKPAQQELDQEVGVGELDKAPQLEPIQDENIPVEEETTIAQNMTAPVWVVCY